MLITKAQIIVIEDITGEDGRKAGERLRVLYQAIPTCGECGHPMKIRDFVWRTIITMSGCRGRIRVRRLVCTAADCYLHTHPRRNLPRGVPDETAGPLECLKNITGGGEDWFARAVERAAGRGGGLHWA